MVDRMSDKMLSDIVQYIRPNFVSCDDVDEDKKEQNINNDFYITTSNIQEKNHEIKQNATDQPIINRQSLQNACLVDFYEKKVGDDYILAKDITIITDDKKKCDEIKSTLKNKGVLIKESDSYSFKRRRADEMTLMTMQDLPVIHNKILIAVIKKDNQEKQQTLIEQNATHIAQLFYY